MKTLEMLKNEKFMLNMKDHWTSEDFETARQLDAEIEKLEPRKPINFTLPASDLEDHWMAGFMKRFHKEG